MGVAVNLIDLFSILPVFLDFCPYTTEVFSRLPGVIFRIVEACPFLDWPDRTVGLGPDQTGLILVRSSPKVKDRTVKQSPFLVRTGLKLL